MTDMDLDSPELFINRELSLIEFNRRVLAQAKRDSYPLLERLRFLCIASANMDEFFEIRVGGLRQQVDFGSQQRGPDNLSAQEQLDHVRVRTRELVNEQYQVLNEQLLPDLRAHGIYFLRRDEWSDNQKRWLEEYFHRELSPILNPIGLDPAHPFPRLLNKILNFVVTLEGQDAFGRHSRLAVVQAPRALPRLVQLPKDVSTNPWDFVFLSSIIHAHVDEMFQGMTVTGCHQFRVTRNSDLWVDEEEITDLRHALEGELPSRRFGDEVRLEIDKNCPKYLRELLRTQFDLASDDVYLCSGPVNLMRLNQIYELIQEPKLTFSGLTPVVPKAIQQSSNMFSLIAEGDVLLHHPFQSFAPVLDFLRQAAQDPDVLSIRQTLYRTGSDSQVVRTLTDAARSGKEVLVVIELRARFDEADNIELATQLQAAGAQVVYGVVGYKTHAKMIVVTRRERGGLRRYVHLGTGNYHSKTSRVYTDCGLLTCDAEIGEDVQQLFRQITSTGQSGQLKKILQSPFTLYNRMCEHIQREIDNHKAGKPARIIAKMNALVEPTIIKELYQASQAGVSIQLIVRGICALRPGIPGVSETIEVRSIIGRFLEHSRVFRFENGGEPITYLSSADWMARNFFARVETGFPIQDPVLAQRIYDECLSPYLQDNSQAWILNADGSYEPITETKDVICAQEKLLAYYNGTSLEQLRSTVTQ